MLLRCGEVSLFLFLVCVSRKASFIFVSSFQPSSSVIVGPMVDATFGMLHEGMASQYATTCHLTRSCCV